MRWLIACGMALVLCACLEDDPTDPRGPAPDAGRDGSRFDPGPRPPDRTGYGSGYGSGVSGGQPAMPDGGADGGETGAAPTDADPGDAGVDGGDAMGA